MNLDHWSLTSAPFAPQPDSRFFFHSRQHERALAAVTYAACEGGEPVLLAGPSGVGKTLLLRHLRRQLPAEQWQVSFVSESGSSALPLLPRVAYHLTGKITESQSAAMDGVISAVTAADNASRGVVLMLDSWRSAAAPLHDELAWLFNLVLENGRLSIILTSDDTGAAANLPHSLNERLFATLSLEALATDEIAGYLEHRMRIAGRTEPIFTAAATSLIALWTSGVPRLINRLANLALHVAYVDRADRVDPGAVRQAIERLDAGRAGRCPINVLAASRSSALLGAVAAESHG